MFYFYIFLMFFIILIMFGKPNTILNNKYFANFITTCFVFTIAYSLGTREYGPDSDLHIYIREFSQFANLSFLSAYNISEREPLFFTLQWIASKASVSPLFFNVFLWLVFAFIFLKALKNIFLRILISFLSEK